jgi:hypothetical protein
MGGNHGMTCDGNAYVLSKVYSWLSRRASSSLARRPSAEACLRAADALKASNGNFKS